MIWHIFGFFALLRLYRGIRVFLIKRKNAKYPVMEGAHPFFYKKGKKGVLLIHGFTSTPDEMAKLGKFLASKNFTVSAPLLKGHGTHPYDLMEIKPKQWQEQIKKEMDKLKKICSKVYIIGSSFGGNLAFDYSTRYHVEGIITVGVPIIWNTTKKHSILFHIFKQFKLLYKKTYNFKKIRKEIIQRKIHYLYIPLISLGRAIKFTKQTKKILPNVKCPLLIMQSKVDAVSSPKTPLYIYDNVSSPIRKISWYKNAYHVIVSDDYQLKRCFREAYEFIEKI